MDTDIPYMMENTPEEFDRILARAGDNLDTKAQGDSNTAGVVIRTPAPFSQAEVSSTFGFTLVSMSKRAAELFFHYCLDCDQDVEMCTCYDEGKGRE